ncbi:TIGR04376 family protein [Chamaesiphon sp. VAR_48_metabat_403]|uniref:TIGR04376 family protein n=1 Tax=Chamaesiphon sp. VAR_48_metabat_403 TaxID=2964700 RepID=UPI00286E06CD|nr:TIGR04376 family protein [Chamaesiphon sp. VAR_48_metabat_403]
MGLIEDMKRFLESQIDDFLIKNPHLELQVIGEQLAQQETDTMQLIVDLKAQEKLTEQEILNTAQEIKNWYDRVQRATAAGRTDLATPAQERVNALLPQGNQLWGKMKGLKERITQAQELLATIKTRRVEVKAKAATAQAQANRDRVAAQSSTSSWGSANNYTSSRDLADPLEAQFRRWEEDEELENLKRNLGK